MNKFICYSFSDDSITPLAFSNICLIATLAFSFNGFLKSNFLSFTIKHMSKVYFARIQRGWRIDLFVLRHNIS